MTTRDPAPVGHDLRSWLDDLGTRGELGVLRSPIDPDQDVAAVLDATDGRRAVLFTDVRGADFPLAGNSVLSRAQLARAMGCGVRDAAVRYLDAVRQPRPWRTVEAADAPVFAHRIGGEELASRLPLTVQHEHDAGRYLTSGLIVVRDNATGRTNLSINRMLAVGERTLRTLVLPGRLRRILAASERSGRDLPVAVVIGVHPVLGLASQAPADPELDDLEVASALHADALAVALCPGAGLPVPAGAEFVLEGRFRAGRREMEGPFGEFPHTYGPGAPAPVIEVTAAWHRPAPIFQTILSGGREHLLIGAVPREAALTRALRAAGLDVAAVRFPASGSCRLHAVVALREPPPGAAVNALLTTLGTVTTVKHALVVDDDVDIFDDAQLGWAIATRVQVDRDLLVIPGARGSSLDPSARESRTAKVGVDATVSREAAARHARTRITPSDPALISRYLADLGCDPRPDASDEG